MQKDLVVSILTDIWSGWDESEEKQEIALKRYTDFILGYTCFIDLESPEFQNRMKVLREALEEVVGTV